MMATGGIGGYLAVHLTKAGHQVATIARRAHLDAIRENGLTLKTDQDEATVAPWIATDDPADIGPVDAVIFGVKGDDLEDAAGRCAVLMGQDTVVVPFLNGVEAADRLARILPPEAIADGVAYVSTTVAAPGVIQQTGAFSRFLFNERDNQPSTRIDALRQAFTDAGINAPKPADIAVEVWKKFVMFAAMSGVTSAARCRIEHVLGDAHLSRVIQDVIAEAAALARARGIGLPDEVEADTWAFVQSLPPAARASTAVDLEHGRRLEIEWVTGAVVRLADALDLPVPVNRTLYGLLHPYRLGAGA